MHQSPKMRSLADRLRQVALFEIGGLVLITPPFVWLSGVPPSDSIGLLAIIAAVPACSTRSSAARHLASAWLTRPNMLKMCAVR